MTAQTLAVNRERARLMTGRGSYGVGVALDLDDKLAEDDRLSEAATARRERYGAVTFDPPLTIDVDRFRARARFGAWYELLPRS